MTMIIKPKLKQDFYFAFGALFFFGACFIALVVFHVFLGYVTAAVGCLASIARIGWLSDQMHDK